MTISSIDVPGIIASLTSLSIIGFSFARIVRQDLPEYRDVKAVLLGAHSLLVGIFLLDLLRSFSTSSQFLESYTLVGGTLILWGAVLLSSVAYVVYVRPSEPTFRERVKGLIGPRLWPHGIAIFSFVAYVLLVDSYLVLQKPFLLVEVSTISGGNSQVTAFNDTFIVLAFFVLTFFIGYPTQTLIQARKRIVDRVVRRAILIITIGWTAVGSGFFITDGLLVLLGLDAIPYGHLPIAIAFSLTTAVFRRPTILSGFFSPVLAPATPRYPFKGRLSLAGKGEKVAMTLLEFDPAVSYEQVVRDFALEEISVGHPVSVFTSRNSPVRSALSDLAGVRFLSFSSQVSSLREGTDPRELLVPENNLSVVLNILRETLKREPGGSTAVVFDNLTNQIVNFGWESSYKFFKQANDILFELDVTSLFLIVRNGQEERVTRLLESLFRRILQFDAEGLHVRK